MTETDFNLDKHWEEVQSEIASRGFIVFPSSILLSERTALWPIEEGLIKYLDLALLLERKVIYLHSSKFNSEDALDLLQLSSPDDSVDYDISTVRECIQYMGVENRSVAKDYLKTTKFYSDRRMSIHLEWVYDGIIHSYWRRADWYADIADLAEKL